MQCLDISIWYLPQELHHLCLEISSRWSCFVSNFIKGGGEKKHNNPNTTCRNASAFINTLWLSGITDRWRVIFTIGNHTTHHSMEKYCYQQEESCTDADLHLPWQQDARSVRCFCEWLVVRCNARNTWRGCRWNSVHVTMVRSFWMVVDWFGSRAFFFFFLDHNLAFFLL